MTWKRSIYAHVRTFEEAVAYPPNQVFIGNLHPDDLAAIQQPSYKHPVKNAQKEGPFGEVGYLKMSDALIRYV